MDHSNTIYDKLKEQHMLLTNNPIYTNFSLKVMLAMAEEIETSFPGIKFKLRLRTKSFNSFNKKAEKLQAENSDIPIYDNIGMKIIVTGIDSEKFQPKEPELLKLSRQITNIQQNIDSLQQNSNPIYEGLISSLNNSSANLVSQYQFTVSKHILEFLLSDSSRFRELGIESIPIRRKSFNTDTKYIAEHAGIRSSKMPSWISELQSVTLENYNIAHNGTAAHDERQGKARLLPDWLFEPNKEQLSPTELENLRNILPGYVVYNGNRKLYKAGLLDCFLHYYQKQLPHIDTQYLDKVRGLLSNYRGHILNFNRDDRER